MTKAVYNPSLHRFAASLAAATFLLLFVCAWATSRGSCFAWPSQSSPPENRFWLWLTRGTSPMEGGHRFLSGAVPILALILAVWIQRVEPRAWVRSLAWSSTGIVLLQVLLGGFAILMGHPYQLSIIHAMLAQIFFGLTVVLALVTSRDWMEPPVGKTGVSEVARLGCFATVAVGVQVLLGAVTRHSGAGLAIPDYPLCFGHLLPPEWSPAILVHFLHRTWAYIVTWLVLYTSYRALTLFPEERRLVQPAMSMGLLVLAQFPLGVLVVLGRKGVLATSLHVVVGAAIFVSCLAFTLNGFRPTKTSHAI